jgi:hypothetical protein
MVRTAGFAAAFYSYLVPPHDRDVELTLDDIRFSAHIDNNHRAVPGS